MEENGCNPDDFTYNSIIKGFLNANEVGKALELLAKMRSQRFAADAHTFSLFLGLLTSDNVSDTDKALLRKFFQDCNGCIGGCDVTLKQLTEIFGTGSRNISGMPASARGRTSATSSASTPASNVRHTVCAHCRQTGHSSSNCPSQGSTSGRARSQGANNQNLAGTSAVTCTSLWRTLRIADSKQTIGAETSIHVNPSADFFAWVDMVNSGTGQQNASHASGRGSNANSRGRGSRARGRGGCGREPTRACFNCGDPTHIANACPNRHI